jgi:NCS1 family nucleobase:cation symporter-1
LLLFTIMPVACVGIFIPELFFAKFGNFLALIGVAFAPLCGIQIADYFVLRGRRLDVRALYTQGPGQLYSFWGGFNPAAMAALAAGCATYVLLLNLLTYRSSSWQSASHRIPPGGGIRCSGIFHRRLARDAFGARRISQSSMGRT